MTQGQGKPRWIFGFIMDFPCPFSVLGAKLNLIDQLESRVDSIELIYADNLRVEFGDVPWLVVVHEGAIKFIPIEWESFDILLNIIKIPLKYIKRLLELIDGRQLAIDSINFWLRRYTFTLVIQNDLCTQIFEGKRPYVSPAEINDIVINCLSNPEVVAHETYEGMFHAFYISDETICGLRVGIRVLYSDSFNVTPRFDGILYDPYSGGILACPVSGRKFQTSNASSYKIKEQAYDLCQLALQQLKQQVVPWVESEEWSEPIDTRDFIYRLSAEIKLTKAQRTILINNMDYDSLPLKDICVKLAIVPLELEQLRDIQIAMTKYLVTRNFK